MVNSKAVQLAWPVHSCPHRSTVVWAEYVVPVSVMAKAYVVYPVGQTGVEATGSVVVVSF